MEERPTGRQEAASIQERRAEPRIPVCFEVHYGVGSEQLRGSTYDISSGGIGLLGEKSYPAGTEINVHFRAPGASHGLLHMKAVVRWSTGNRLGLQLVNVKPSDHRKILELVERLAGKQRG